MNLISFLSWSTLGATRLVKLDPKDGEFYQVLAASLQHLDAYAKGDLR